MNIFKRLFDRSTKAIASTDKYFKKIKELESEFDAKSFDEMKERVSEMKAELKQMVDAIPSDKKMSVRRINRRESFPEEERELQKKLMEFLPEVFAMMNQSFKRLSGNGYHDVQLKAGAVLAEGQVLVEQYTGEGKTRTFMLPLALYALVGRGAHLVTVNSYLTKVGAEYAGHFLSPLGLSVGIIAPSETFKFIPTDQLGPYKTEEIVKQAEEQALSIDKMSGLNLIECSKQDAYACDVTYATNNELGFDYLRDNMSWELARVSQRELYFCIIDEADSILIDEARTPLIISSTPSDADTEKYSHYAKAVKDLEETKDFEVDYKSRSVNLTEEGMARVESILEIENAWDDFATAFHLENALKAKALFIKDDKYVVRNGEVLIVDEFTGRTLAGRRYSEGLHQAIEAKEGVEIKQESRTFATITFQNFFRLYKVVCGGSGTVMTESEEFYKIYGLDSFVIPTNKPRIRIDHADVVYKNQTAKFNAVVEDVKEVHTQGRPVLIGTTSVEKSELVSELLDKEGIKHKVLNAKFHEQESRIVSEAGKKGAVTVATNMAGRGTDIVIGGGNRGDKAWQEIIDLGGLHVIGTERHDSRRIDNQLRGRTGRQGEPGSTIFYSALDDQILRVMGGEVIARLVSMVNVPESEPIPNPFISRQIESAQKRVEGINFDSRKSIVEYDDVMNQHREIFYSRRKKLVESSENAVGRIKVEGKVVDTSLPEYKDKADQFESLIETQKEALENFMYNIVVDEAARKISTLLDELENTKQENVEKLIEKITRIIPTEKLANHFGIKVDALVDTMTSYIKDNSIDVYQKIQSAVESAYTEKFEELSGNFYYISKMISLDSMDKKWVDHLEMMKGIRDGIRMQSYAQKNPLLEYKNVAFGVFSSLISAINLEIGRNFFRITKAQRQSAQIQTGQLQTNEDQITDVLTGDREMLAGQGGDQSISADKKLTAIQKQLGRQRASLSTNAKEKGVQTKTSNSKKYGRNDKVSVKYTDGRELKDVKYKKVEKDVESGEAILL